MKKYLFLFLTIIIIQDQAHAEICGKTDDRVPSFDTKVGRASRENKAGVCVATLVGKNCVVTYGACTQNIDFVEFNVPMSVAGVPQFSDSTDRYYINKDSVAFEARGIGQQWAVLKLLPNSVTGKHAGDIQEFYKVAKRKSEDNDPIKVIQYSYALSDTEYVREGVNPNQYGDMIHFAQSSSNGSLIKASIFLIPEIIEHNADTSYGSGGAPVINLKTGELIGINTHGGCRATYLVTAGARYTNSGTSTTGSSKFRRAIEACNAH